MYHNYFRIFILCNILIPLFVCAEKILISPSELLQASNVQITASYVYSMFKERDIKNDWGYQLYTEYLKAMHKQKTGFDLEKEEITSALYQLDIILNQVKSCPSDTYDSSVVIDDNRNIIHGFKQATACLLYGKKITCEIQHEPAQKRDVFHYLRQGGLEQKYLDAIAFEYLKLNKNARISIIWPLAIDEANRLTQKLEWCGPVIYQKYFELKNNGHVILLQHIADKASRAKTLAPLYFPETLLPPYKLRVILFETTKNLEEITQFKNELRREMAAEKGIGNPALVMHINNDHQESIETARMVFFENSLHFMNHATIQKYGRFNSLFPQYKGLLTRLVEKHAIESDDFCANHGTVLGVYGMRDVGDIDFLHHGHTELISDYMVQTLQARYGDIGSHNLIFEHFFSRLYTIDDVIFNPENHFYYRNVKFASLDVTRKCKPLRGREKDKRDIKLIEDFLSKMQ